MIYFMPISDKEQLESQYQAWMPHLPLSRQAKLLRYRFAKDRWLCAAAYMLLLYALKNEYNLTGEQIDMQIAESGKPFLSSHPHIHFNLSHCDAGVACGISDTPIGIDVEMVKQINDNVVKRVCSASDRLILKYAVNPERAFAALWTLKESWVKATGCGLAFPLDEVNVKEYPTNHYYVCKEGYIAQLCAVSFPVVFAVCTPDTFDKVDQTVSIVNTTIFQGGLA